MGSRLLAACGRRWPFCGDRWNWGNFFGSVALWLAWSALA